ncbi:hypothetical protein BDA96_04G340100 [Sorghum bicolor]|uniref:Bet v I/Major latex protein domain-containing protein n=1 Tax=Sorghum bicolor TaxID=4558 RepID=A0A921R9K1_SORBI|nr:hypothetical protein BDA96_04G340100 [Sorghum bicolor]
MSLKPTSRVPTCVGGRSLLLDQLVPQLFPQLFSKIEIVEGDGGVGTILLVTSPPAGISELESFKEKFTIVDNEKDIKEAEND